MHSPLRLSSLNLKEKARPKLWAEVQRRRAQARQLRTAAAAGWAAGWAAFEARLLG